MDPIVPERFTGENSSRFETLDGMKFTKQYTKALRFYPLSTTH